MQQLQSSLSPTSVAASLYTVKATDAFVSLVTQLRVIDPKSMQTVALSILLQLVDRGQLTCAHHLANPSTNSGKVTLLSKFRMSARLSAAMFDLRPQECQDTTDAATAALQATLPCTVTD